MLSTFGMSHLEGCITGELPFRPVPQVFEAAKLKKLADLFAKWAPHIYARILPEIVPPVQTFNKTSRLGWPYFTSALPKKDIVLQAYQRTIREGPEIWKKAFVPQNVRLQAEATDKIREYMVVDDSGTVYPIKVDRREHMIDVAKLGMRVPSRTRLVFNFPVINLVKQVLDTAIHNALMKYPVFHHDMFGKKLVPVTGYHICLDVSHMERYTVAAISTRNAAIGGLYGQVSSMCMDLPFIVPSNTWKKFWFLRPNKAEGYMTQYGSGDSAVAPSQKELFLALYAEFVHTQLGYSEKDAIQFVLGGGDKSFNIRNYGDDNSIAGEEKLVKDVAAWLEGYLAVGVEDPAKFLGFLWHEETREWKLGKESYLTKTYLNERRPFSTFRKYPFHGWVEKRKVYTALGERLITEQIYPLEDQLLAKAGLPWQVVIAEAEREAMAARRNDTTLTTDYYLGREYALTAEQKMDTGEYDGIGTRETAAIIKSLLPNEWKRRLNWK